MVVEGKVMKGFENDYFGRLWKGVQLGVLMQSAGEEVVVAWIRIWQRDKKWKDFMALAWTLLYWFCFA